MLSIKNSIILTNVICSIHVVSATIYIMSEIPFFSCNFDIGTPIFLSESFVYKITNSRFQMIMWDWGVCVEKIKCLDWCSCTDIKLVKWWQQTCWLLHVADTMGLVLVLQYLTNLSFMVLSSWVRRHDKSFVVHLLGPAINRCLYCDLCMRSLGVQHRYGRFWSSSDVSNPTDVMDWLWLFTIV